MAGPTNPAFISALAAVFGSLVGALGSTTAAWIAQRHADRRTLLAQLLAYREQLYSDFISEAAKTMFDATQHTLQDPYTLVPVYALLSRIRLGSSSKVVESAEQVIETVLKTYSKPNFNLTADEIKAHAAELNEPLREFSTICRADLELLLKTR